MITQKVTRFLNMQSRAVMTTVTILSVVLIGVIDRFTGPEISLSIFYLIPVYLATWFVGRKTGLLLAVISASAWFIADLLAGSTYSHPAIPYWNTTVRLGFFLIVASTLSKLKRMIEDQKELARTDHLTGVFNGRVFYELCERELDRSRRYKHPCSLAYIDLDNFKVINDRHGHAVGDALLRVVSQGLKNNLRVNDVLARLGGDEFAILLPETGDAGALVAVSRAKENLLELMETHGWPVTFSVGMVTFLRPPDTVDEMVTRADRIMYTAKSSGKNLIHHEVVGS